MSGIEQTERAFQKQDAVFIGSKRLLGKKKTAEVSVPYRPRVGEAEINTWGDGLLNLRFLFTHRLGLTRQITPWGPE